MNHNFSRWFGLFLRLATPLFVWRLNLNFVQFLNLLANDTRALLIGGLLVRVINLLGFGLPNVLNFHYHVLLDSLSSRVFEFVGLTLVALTLSSQLLLNSWLYEETKFHLSLLRFAHQFKSNQ